MMKCTVSDQISCSRFARVFQERFAATRSERGSILPLVSLFVALGLVIILISAAATSLYLERKQLFSLADSAALYAAESFRASDARLSDGRVMLHLSDAQVRDAAQLYLSGVGHQHEHLQLTRAQSPDQASAVIGLTAYWRPPLLTLFVPDGIPVSVEATARAVFSR